MGVFIITKTENLLSNVHQKKGYTPFKSEFCSSLEVAQDVKSRDYTLNPEDKYNTDIDKRKRKQVLLCKKNLH